MKTGLGRYRPHRAVAASFTPTDIAGLLAWYDASNAGSITASSGDVSQWDDLSGNTRHVTQGGASLQPKTGTRTINGLNAISWADGTIDVMASASWTDAPPCTLVGVVQYDATGLSNSQWFGFGAVAVYQASGAYAIYAGSANVSGGTVDTNPHIWIAVINGASSALYIDSPSSTTGTGNPGASGFSLTRFGGDQSNANAFDGLLAEIALYDSALDLTNRTLIYNGWKSKWGTP